MGEVYLAEDTRLGRRVAIKVLRSDSADGIKRLKHEAQLAASLDHPNICSIYEVGEDSGQHFIAMQYVEGDSLAAKLRHGPLGLRETLELALPIADALAEAHRHGIVHRDVKPHNIMIGPRHQVKMLDFGLAKAWSGGAAATSEGPTFTSLTQSGALTGTLAYMSPEQARAERLDSRSDIFSFGAVLHEMLAGRPLFARGNPAETLSAILTFEPSPVTREVAEAPEELERIVSKALRKDREQRYQDIRDMRIDLAALREDREFRARLERSREDGADARATLRDHRHSGSGPSIAGRSRRWLLPTGVLLAIAAGSAAVYVHRSNLAWADAQLARVDELAHAGDYAAAYDLAQRIRRYRSETEELKRLLPVVSDDLSVSTAPSGAEVRLERFEPQADRAARAAPFVVGRTPISHVAIPRGDYVLRVELAGHERFERTISSSLARGEFGVLLSPAIQVAARLLESGKVPSRMIPVPAGPYTLVGYGQPTQAAAHLGDYFIDKYEVSNREYKQFIDAGGYRERAFWKHPFANDGKGLSWEQAMPLFVDRTGLPGPRNWSGGSPPDGKADHPVTGVSWFESAAYAAFRGKTLPSIYQWEKAARDGLYHFAESAMPWGLYEKGASRRANFESRGTVPVDQLEFGMSPFGGFNLAGNVSEWLSNETSTGFAAGGGSWADPPYIFGDYGTFPGFFSSDRLGFRCALTAPGVTGDQGGAKISAAEQAPVYPRSSDAQFQAWLAHYRYDRTPLEAKVEESVETPDWRRERVSYVSAGERVSAYLYLPRSSRPPFQVIQFLPGSDAYRGRPVVEFAEGRLAPNVKAGRAIFIVTLSGYTGRERPAGYARPDRSSVAFRELAVRDATDLRRGLDYLETRSDVDRTRLAFMNVSIGWQGIVFSAVEPRYRSVILMADGLYPNQVSYVAEANPVNFAPHIKPPKLMLNGRWDEDFAFKTEAEPLFKLLREPKRLQLFDGGHVPPAEIAVPIVNGWLDETLGPVKRD